MRAIMRYIQVAFVIAVVSVFLYVVVYYSKLEGQIFSFVGSHGYIAIFLIAFILDAVMQPLAADLPIAAGILIGLDVYLTTTVAIIASCLASFAGYFIGRMYGDYLFRRIYGLLKYRRWKKLFKRYDRLTITIAAVTPVPYVPICWMAGIFKMKFRDFIIFGIGPRTLRFIGVAYLVILISGI